MFTKEYSRLDKEDIASTQRLTSKDHGTEETLDEIPFRSWNRHQSYRGLICFTVLATVWSVLLFTGGFLANHTFRQCGFEQGFATDLGMLDVIASIFYLLTN